MRAGLLSLAGGGGTTDPLLRNFLLAQHVNLAAGGAVVAPWEVDELPEEWVDAALGLRLDLPGMTAGKAQVEEYLERWRAEHRRGR